MDALNKFCFWVIAACSLGLLGVYFIAQAFPL